MSRRTLIAVLTLTCVAGLAAVLRADRDDDRNKKHVLLLSVDGLHASDLERFVDTHPRSALAWLSARSRTYTHATATKPSDSFPGLLAMVTGGTPRSTGVYYDDGYDRTLAAASGTCTPGTRVQWKQNLDVMPFSFTTAIDELKLPRDPAGGCAARVWPHQFPRANNVFELVKAAGGRTAWSDKHPAYEFLKGPSGTGIDDLYTPEITRPTEITPATTNSFELTMAYDDMKVAAIVNEIKGFDHSGVQRVGVPTVFGMNFQAVSVGQKLAAEQVLTAPHLTGGYLDGAGTPSAGLEATLEHTDASIGTMVYALYQQDLLDSTTIIVSAKHGNSPIDPRQLVRVDPTQITNVVTSVGAGIAQLSADTGPLIWLKDQTRTGAVVTAFTNSMTGSNPARIAGILAGADLAARYANPLTDSRAPDIILLPVPGTVYTTSTSKIADHGGFGDDDVHVALLVTNPQMQGHGKTISDPVETRQIACTILKAVDIDCDGLMSQRIEPSKALPKSNHGECDGEHDASDDCQEH